VELHSSRGRSELGLCPISYPDIAAWASLTETQVTPEDVRLIKLIDVLAINNGR